MPCPKLTDDRNYTHSIPNPRSWSSHVRADQDDPKCHGIHSLESSHQLELLHLQSTHITCLISQAITHDFLPELTAQEMFSVSIFLGNRRCTPHLKPYISSRGNHQNTSPSSLDNDCKLYWLFVWICPQNLGCCAVLCWA
jgi:hypothetical protein